MPAPSAEGAGVGARDAYVPRPVPTPPIVPDLPPGGEATRAVAPSMPSVARSARRTGRLALILAAAAVVVTIGGLILIVAAFLAP
ncbi:hypothetical protein FJ656_25550 [Schumannella luteola]|nr:hypothetical protein FJ656_25550 [Schumannella luteola]